MKECQNCGIPMLKNEDFGNNDPNNFLCRRCFKDKSIGVSEDDNKKQNITNAGFLSLDDVDIVNEDSGL